MAEPQARQNPTSLTDTSNRNSLLPTLEMIGLLDKQTKMLADNMMERSSFDMLGLISLALIGHDPLMSQPYTLQDIMCLAKY